MKIAVSIINFRTGELTLACVRSVLDDMGDAGDIDGEIIVVDNASGDGSADQIAAWIAEQPTGTPVRLIRSASNSGFSGGHNQGIRAAKADYYLILNSDALLKPGCLRALLDTARAHPDAGLISPRIEDEAGNAQVSLFRFHSPVSEFIRGANSGPVTRALKSYVVPLPGRPEADTIGWVSFACVLINARMIADIGAMDEGYFLYFEDTEYSLRARRKGWTIAIAETATVVHFHGGSGSVVDDIHSRRRLPKYYYSSRSRFLYQAYGRAGLYAANLLWHAGRILAQARRLSGRPVPVANDREWRDLWTNGLRPLGPDHRPG